MQGSPPNILFIVWDACRYDYASEYASNLQSLAESNLWFEKAIAPAPWSLPSHASLFTGEYPHEHGITRLGDSLDSLPLARELGEDGYRCYGVSANGFACQRTGFHGGFDEFYYTRGRERFHDALNVSGFALDRLKESKGKLRPAVETIAAALGDQHPIKSLVNMAAVGVGSLGVRTNILQRIPHPLFASDSGYCYTPAATTARLIDVFERESGKAGPFFVFANYMDTHRPYKPGPDKQERHLGSTLERGELGRLNDEIAAPWPFMAKAERGEISEEDVEAVQGLYAGEVETVDEHLTRLLDALTETGHREDTLIVVTSDHGENLGETDEMGRRRMGHEASVSDQLAHVPLVIAHPDIDSHCEKDPVSLVQVPQILTSELTKSIDNDQVLPDTGRAACEYPPAGGEQLYEKHPDVPKVAIDYRVTEASLAMYQNFCRVVCESNGQRWPNLSDDGENCGDLPNELYEECSYRIQIMMENYGSHEELDGNQISQLEALGYL